MKGKENQLESWAKAPMLVFCPVAALRSGDPSQLEAEKSTGETFLFSHPQEQMAPRVQRWTSDNVQTLSDDVREGW